MRVVCSLQAFDERHVKDARERGVQLVTWSETADTLQKSPILAVIGHGRITGYQARELSERLRCPRVHFVHMWAESIEPLKHPNIEKAMSVSHERGEIERELSTTAQCVVAVGPRLQKDIQNYLANGTKVLSFLPGFATEHTPWTPVSEPPTKLVCLVVGRADPEDVALKGFDIAARAVVNVDREALSALPELMIRGLPLENEPASPAHLSKAQRVKDQMEAIRKGSEVTFTYRPFTSDEDEVGRDFRQASVFLMPSRAEGFGLVGLDAIALGVPCLVSSKSGLADFLHDEGLAKNVVVKMTGDLEVDVAAWQKEIEFVLRDSGAAFARAKALRTSLESKLSWRASTDMLLTALRDLRDVSPQPAPKPLPRTQGVPPLPMADLVAAALHLERDMDMEAADETRLMLGKLTATGVPDGDVTSMWNAALDCASHARQVDSDMLTQLDLAIAVLKQKYAKIGFDPSKEGNRLRPRMKPNAASGDMEALFKWGGLVHLDLSSIPTRVLVYARAHGFRPNSAALSGHAASVAEFGRACLARGESPNAYAFENLARLFDAAEQLLAIDTARLGRGYMNDGGVNREALERPDTWLVIARDVRKSEMVEVYGETGGVFSLAASFRGRDMGFGRVGIARTTPRIEVVANSWKYVYRWGPDASTPEREWETPDGENVKCWFAAAANQGFELWLESAYGQGVAYRDEIEIRRWRSSKTTSAAFWRDTDGRVARAVLDGKGQVHIYNTDKDTVGASIDLRDALRDRLTSMHQSFDDVHAAREIWVGRRNGRPCLVIPCGLDPDGLVLAFVDPQTRTLVRAPLMSPFPIEECAVFDVGSTCLLAATTMHDAPGAMAIWNVSDDTTDAPPAFFGQPSTKGWALAVATGDVDAEVYFTAHNPTACDYGPSIVWRWTSATGVATPLFALPDLVASLAVAKRTRSQVRAGPPEDAPDQMMAATRAVAGALFAWLDPAGS